MGVTRDSPDDWVWGPYPVHDNRCQDRIAHPRLQQLLETDDHTRSCIQLEVSDPQTEAVLEHWQLLMASPFIDRLAVQHWTESLSGPERPEPQTPWPDMDTAAHLAAGRLTCLGTRSRSREAQAGYDVAVHNSARGLRVTMFAPDLPPRNPLPGLTIFRDKILTPRLVRERLEHAAHQGSPADLVVIDRLQLMTATEQDSGRLSSPEQVEAVSIELKHTAMTEALGQPPVLLIARLERPRRDGQPLDIDDLGIAADLEYHTDTLALLDRTQPAEVDVFIVKDRSGPAPRRLTVPW
ncbi:DnaB-like helicase C-terminal domain-containing protein [Streptomyces lincolnensis]|uniref:DnaB-like helicase C-terminal domain-containing protein n=1 Tax=Streptomyces lincolnensis TaxID=1915 RepID=UPI0037D726E7